MIFEIVELTAELIWDVQLDKRPDWLRLRDKSLKMELSGSLGSAFIRVGEVESLSDGLAVVSCGLLSAISAMCNSEFL